MKNNGVLQIVLLSAIFIYLFLVFIILWNARSALTLSINDLESKINSENLDQTELRIEAESTLDDQLDRTDGIEKVRFGEIIESDEVLNENEDS